MPKNELELSPLKKKILEKIVNDNINRISYYHPKLQLGKEVVENYSQTVDALSSFERDFGIMVLDPSLKFKLFWIIKSRCGYEVYPDKAKALYDSINPKN